MTEQRRVYGAIVGGCIGQRGGIEANHHLRGTIFPFSNPKSIVEETIEFIVRDRPESSSPESTTNSESVPHLRYSIWRSKDLLQSRFIVDSE